MSFNIAWVPLFPDHGFGAFVEITRPASLPFMVINEATDGGMRAQLTPKGLLIGILHEYARGCEEPPLMVDWEQAMLAIPEALESMRKGYAQDSIGTLLLNICNEIAREYGLRVCESFYESAMLLQPDDFRIKTNYIIDQYRQWDSDSASITKDKWQKILDVVNQLDFSVINPAAIPTLEFMKERAHKELDLPQ